MGPHGDGSDDMEKSEVAQSESRRPISTVVFVIGTLLFLHVSIYVVIRLRVFGFMNFFCCLLLGAAAMQAEALPLVNKFGLSETSDSPLRAPKFSLCFSPISDLDPDVKKLANLNLMLSGLGKDCPGLCIKECIKSFKSM